MTASAARTIARGVVTEVREREAWAHEVLHRALSAAAVAPRDRAFATRLAYGTIASRGTCDQAVIERLSPGTALQPVVSDCLAVSAYEIIFMSTEARAAVHEGVELVRAVQPRAAGLANAVLRRLAREADDFPWGDPIVDDEALARKYAHPFWMTAMWIDSLGREAAAQLLAANNEPAPLFLAVLSPDPAEVTRESLESEGVSTQLCPVSGCLVATDPFTAVASSAIRERDVLVMDAAAQFAAACVPITSGASVVELGAGRGGKSLAIAARARRLEIEIDLLAVDLHAGKLTALEKDAERHGFDTARTLVADATDPNSDGMPEPGSVDAVLVDAPCSGLGTLRRRPDRRWRASEAELPALAALGSKLLATAADLVKPGGFVVYSTCTVSRVENVDVLEGFLATESGSRFTIDSLAKETPDEWRGFLGPQGWLQSIPREDGPDGHFVARLKRAIG